MCIRMHIRIYLYNLAAPARHTVTHRKYVHTVGFVDVKCYVEMIEVSHVTMRDWDHSIAN